MDQEYRIKRHTELWSERNKQVKRVIWGGLAFAAFVLINVLRPYEVGQHESVETRGDLAQLETQRQEIDLSLQRLEEFEKDLAEVRRTVEREPWMARKDALIVEFQRLNNSGGGNLLEYRRRANRTVEAIASDVKAEIAPLSRFLSANPNVATSMPRFFAELRALPSAIDRWVAENRDREWYRTTELKAETVQELSTELQIELLQVVATISEEQPRLADRRTELNAQIDAINELAAAKVALLEDLEAAMASILPQWVRGLITVDQMVELYPWIMLGLAVYLIGAGVTLTRHYAMMARGRSWSPEERSEPTFSSLWTLTWRGRLGTVATISVYLGILAALWFFFEQGAAILANSGVAENAGLVPGAGAAFNTWLARTVLLGAVVVAVAWPYYQSRFLANDVPREGHSSS